MPIPDNGPLDGVQDVLDSCTDQFLIKTLVWTDPSGHLMGPEDDLLAKIRPHADRIDEIMQANIRGGNDDEDALNYALHDVFPKELGE